MNIHLNLRQCLFVILIVLFTTNILAQTDFWVPVNNGMTSFNPNDLAVNSNDVLFLATRGDGIFVSTNAGGLWVQKNNGLTNLETWTVAVNSSNEIFVGTWDGIFKSTDNAENCVKLETGLTFNQIREISVASNGYIFAVAPNYGVIRSVDNGVNWVGVNNGLSGIPNTIAADLHGQIMLGNNLGEIYFSNNYGDGWTKSSLGLPQTTSAPILALLETSNEKYFAGTGDGLYMSTDYGLNWSQVHDGGGNGWVHSMTTDYQDNLIIGTGQSGVFVSGFPNGTWFKDMNEGLTHLGVYSLVANSSNNIFAVTGEGIFKSEPLTGVEDNDENLAINFQLYQNYPNPFNPTTTIKFSIPMDIKGETLNTKLVVYDVLGKKVTVLVNQKLQSGTHEIQFAAGDFSSGIYFYKLEIGNITDTKKMLLIR